LQENRRQEGVRASYTRKALNPSHSPILAALVKVPCISLFPLLD
jgi:hypothetical protein